MMLLCVSSMGAWAQTYKITSVGSPIDLSTLEVGQETPVLMYAGGNGAYGFVSYVDASGARFTIDQTNHANVVGLASLPYEYGITKLQNGDVISYRVRTYTASNKYLPGWSSSDSGNYSAGTLGASNHVTDFIATENSTTSNVLSGGNVYTFTANTTNGITVQKGSGIFTIPSTTNTVPLQFCTYEKQKVTGLISGTDELLIKFSTDTESYDYYIKCNNVNYYLNPFTFPTNNNDQRGVFRFYESTTAGQYLLYEVGSGKWFTYSQTDEKALTLVAVEDKAKAGKFVVKYVSGTAAPYNICPSGNQNRSFNWFGGVGVMPYRIGTDPATNTMGFYGNTDPNSKWLIEAVSEENRAAAELAATKAAANAEIASRKQITALYAETDAAAAVTAVSAAASIDVVNTAMDVFYRSAEGKYFKMSNDSRSNEVRYVAQTATGNDGIGTTTTVSKNTAFTVEYVSNGLYHVKSAAVENGYWKNLDSRNNRLKAVNSAANAGLWNFRMQTNTENSSGAIKATAFNCNSTTGWYFMHNSTNAYVVDWTSAASAASFWTVTEADYVDVVYNYTIGEDVVDTESYIAVDKNSAYPDLTKSFSYYTREDKPTGNVTSSVKKNIALTWVGPFEEGKIYQLQNRETDSYVASDKTGIYVHANTTSANTEPNHLWYFVRKPGTALKFYVMNVNGRGMTGGNASTKTNITMTDTPTAYTLFKKNDTGTFCLKYEDSEACVGKHQANYQGSESFPTGHSGLNKGLCTWLRGGGDLATDDPGSYFMVEEFEEPNFGDANSSYVGDPAYDAAAKEAVNAYIGNKNASTLKGALNAYNATEVRAISAEKYYVIESAKNHNIRIYIDDITNHKFRYAAVEDYMLQGLFRFTNKGSETSSNWGGSSQEYDTYKIYCVGSTQKGYMGWGTYNTQVASANSSDAAVVKVVPVGSTSTFQLAVYDAAQNNGVGDNCTYSIGNAQTSVADNATGEIVSWNTYDGTNCNVWRIREVEDPTALTQSVSISSVGVATFYTGKTLSIPEGVKAKKVVDAQDPQQGDVYHLVYEELQDEIPAGTPVVLFGDENPSYQFSRSMEPHDYIVTSAAGDENNRLIGTLASDVTATGKGQDGTLYALGNKDAGVAFYHFLGETLTAGKAYLDASGIGVSGVRAFAIFDEGTGTVTHIDAITGETIGEGTAFDLSGRRVNANIKGISIMNGKKVIR